MKLGATIGSGGTHFGVWAPAAKRVDVLLTATDGVTLELTPEKEGHFHGFAAGIGHGASYRYRLDGAGSYPDPYSRSQPNGPHGDSMIVDPLRYQWRDARWRGLDPDRQVIYELHVGTFTPEGTFAAAAKQLPVLRKLGVTCLELLPVAEFAGTRGWGYDGVDLFAPYHHDGEPDSLRRFVDGAHEVGLGIILDVVYNHVGDDGNYLVAFQS